MRGVRSGTDAEYPGTTTIVAPLRAACMPPICPPIFSQPRQKPPIVNKALRLPPVARASLTRAGGDGAVLRHHSSRFRRTLARARDRGRPPDYQEALMKAALLVSSALLAIASASATAQGSITKEENGALVAANGMTVYTFDKDKPNAGTSACSGPCETLWPPYKASATDVPVGPYTIVKRDDGSPQWAYKGKPLYFYSKDMKQGERNGDNFKNVWHVVAP